MTETTTCAHAMSSKASVYVETYVAYTTQRFPSIFSLLRIINIFSYLLRVFHFFCSVSSHAPENHLMLCRFLSPRCTLFLPNVCNGCTDRPYIYIYIYICTQTDVYNMCIFYFLFVSRLFNIYILNLTFS